MTATRPLSMVLYLLGGGIEWRGSQSIHTFDFQVVVFVLLYYGGILGQKSVQNSEHSQSPKLLGVVNLPNRLTFDKWNIRVISSVSYELRCLAKAAHSPSSLHLLYTGRLGILQRASCRFASLPNTRQSNLPSCAPTNADHCITDTATCLTRPGKGNHWGGEGGLLPSPPPPPLLPPRLDRGGQYIPRRGGEGEGSIEPHESIAKKAIVHESPATPHPLCKGFFFPFSLSYSEVQLHRTIPTGWSNTNVARSQSAKTRFKHPQKKKATQCI